MTGGQFRERDECGLAKLRLRQDLRSDERNDLIGGEASVRETGEDVVDSVERLRD